MRFKWMAPLLGVLVAAGCAGTKEIPASSHQGGVGAFEAEMRPGRLDANPAWPFLRVGPDGRLYMVWTEHDLSAAASPGGGTGAHAHGADSTVRAAFMASTNDDGKTWSSPVRINDRVENVQGDENEAKIAFGPNGQIYSAWAIPDQTGNKMKANIRFSMIDGSGTFVAAKTLNEVPNAARFPALQTAPDGTVFVAWIDRRIDSPAPRQLYMTRLSPSGEVQTKNYQIADDSCECCRITLAFTDGGKTVYMAYRQKPANNIRNIVVRKSTDGGATFGSPVVVSDDGWEIAGCPHSGAVMATDASGAVHVVWFTAGKKPEEAGIYYSVSRDGGQTFAPRHLVDRASGTGVLRPYLAVGEQGEVYIAWMNYPKGKDQTQIYFRHLASDGSTWSQVEQVSQAKGNAVWPNLAVSKDRVYLGWTEQEGDSTWVVLRTAPISAH